MLPELYDIYGTPQAFQPTIGALMIVLILCLALVLAESLAEQSMDMRRMEAEIAAFPESVR